MKIKRTCCKSMSIPLVPLNYVVHACSWVCSLILGLAAQPSFGPDADPFCCIDQPRGHCHQPCIVALIVIEYDYHSCECIVCNDCENNHLFIDDSFCQSVCVALCSTDSCGRLRRSRFHAQGEQMFRQGSSRMKVERQVDVFERYCVA